MKSPISSNFGLRSEADKIFDNLVPVQMQIQSNEERKMFVRLSVELVPAGISSSSFRKVIKIKKINPNFEFLVRDLKKISSRIYMLKLLMKKILTHSTL